MTEQVQLTGWGRTAPSRATLHHLSAEPATVVEAVRRAGARGVVGRGLGRSYGDAAQNAGGDVLVLDQERHIGEVDAATGTLRVDAGVDLDQLIRHLLPQGYFVAVTPGTRFVTVGGAIAADIHGKNHHVDGSFGQHVLEITLVDGTGRTRQLTPGATPDLFWATVGGMGLTGVIVSAVLRLRPVESSYIKVDTDRAAGLAEVLDLMRTGDAAYTYSVAWIDLLARGKASGRAVLTRGDHATLEDLSDKQRAAPLSFDVEQRLRAPSWAPELLMNHWSIKAFNEMWFRKAPRRRRGEIQHLASFFHPLDGVADWNRLYGSRGLVQYQFVVPDEAEEALAEAVRMIADSGHPSFLSVLKRFGPGSPGYLSFPTPGWTLALDLPTHPGLTTLFARLDALVLGAGGRLYLAKDARARAETIQTMYPRLDAFRAARAELDPDGVITSDLARRLGL